MQLARELEEYRQFKCPLFLMSKVSCWETVSDGADANAGDVESQVDVMLIAAQSITCQKLRKFGVLGIVYIRVEVEGNVRDG